MQTPFVAVAAVTTRFIAFPPMTLLTHMKFAPEMLIPSVTPRKVIFDNLDIGSRRAAEATKGIGAIDIDPAS
ncbi:hypothetical protein [Sinorhizobium psoraleae]|uniref:Uncharacterized protein n=1 Tax=Sinorhizobium psoraleae TaxID=520838 RepID=A0ABT4KBT7_9HYPH|nr:hypothetical protein [Sinorhizobium psoraleae]MCZ4089319.1 hypothetical protein [Sinorhizobium psoraleae]